MRTVTVQVPFKGPGGVITNCLVDFEVVEEGGVYRARAQLSEADLRLADLPGELLYKMEKDQPVSLRGIKDGNQHVIAAIVAALRNS